MSLLTTIVVAVIFNIFVAIVALMLFDMYRQSAKKSIKKQNIVERHHKNPVLVPHPDHPWESYSTFNPGAVLDDDEQVHLLYRAMGDDGVSRMGYSKSEDGFHFGEKIGYPVFSMQSPRKMHPTTIQRPDPVMYPSGGSWGGCEDPRIVRIGDRIYVTFNAFDGWDFIRMGCVSINAQDFFEKKWNWSQPMLISPPGELHKNWILFPEKINGKFAILHSIYPEISIDYVNRLEDLASGVQVIKSPWKDRIPRDSWDTWLRGAGPPPLRTERGWLVLYHAMDASDPDRYKLGAFLLDLNDPTKILARAPEPLLVPDMWYENTEPGIVYVCGALIKQGTLFLYYGGGNKYVCVATAPLDHILNKLVAV